MKKKLIFITTFILLLTSVAIGNNMVGRNVFKDKLIEGFFIEYRPEGVTIEEYGGQRYTIPLKKDAELLVDTRPVDIKEFVEGMEVYAELQGRSISYMDAFSVDQPGYISPESRVKVGTINLIDRDQLQIKDSSGAINSYFISPTSLILKSGKNVNSDVLYVGDTVKLYFDSMDSSYPSKIVVEGDSVKVKGLYRGNIKLVNDLEDKIVFDKLELFSNGSWTSANIDFNLNYNSSTPIYINGFKISNNNLKNYRGKTAYLAIKDDFGSDKIEKLVLRDRYEVNFSDKIDTVNRFASQMELANKRNIAYNDGTIVIKSNRLVDSSEINPNSDGLIIADSNGKDFNAGVVYIYNEGINNSNIGQDQIYTGRLDKIFQNNFELRDFAVLNNNDWESFRDSKELFYDNSSYIYDTTNERIVSPKEFMAREYAVEDSRRNRKPRDWYAYVYTNGDRASNIFVSEKSDSILKQRVSLGIVENKPYEDSQMGWTLNIKDMKDWSSRYSEWVAKNSSHYLYLKDAMIIKNGERIDIEDIKQGDSLYLVRDSNFVKVLIVK